MSGDGEHTVSYYSTDNAGNAEDVRSVAVRIDATAPQTADESDPVLATDGDSAWRQTGRG